MMFNGCYRTVSEITKRIGLFFLVILITACTESPTNNLLSSTRIKTEALPQATEILPTPLATDYPITDVPSQAVAQTDSQPALSTLEPSPTATSPQIENATQLPEASMLRWQVVANHLQKPVGLVNAADGSDRLFVLEQTGRILIWQAGSLLSDAFLDIRSQVGSQGFEQGLLGLAFHPQFSENGYFFVNYTDKDGETNIARFTVDRQNPNFADLTTEKTLLKIHQPFANHNGGMLVFGPDGYLYIGLGDGGSGGDPHGNGQSLDSMLGKILRLDIDTGDLYTIPDDNPFLGGQALPEIWAYGLRNPWRFSFDALTGDLFIADVGQNQWEEIDYLPAGSPGGANFGWNFFEAHTPYSHPGSNLSSFIFPVFEYDHSQGCSVTGGSVYRGGQIPELYGVYLFGDYCSGNIWGLLKNEQNSWQSGILFENQGPITSFGVDEQGEIYMLLHSGQMLRLEKE